MFKWFTRKHKLDITVGDMRIRVSSTDKAMVEKMYDELVLEKLKRVEVPAPKLPEMKPIAGARTAQHHAPKPTPAPAKTEPTETRPRTLPIVGSENRASFPMGETAKISGDLASIVSPPTAPEKPAPAKLSNMSTRIENDGTRTYRTRYKCTCGRNGHRYSAPTYKYVKCHGCGTALFKTPATNETFQHEGNEVPVMDWNECHYKAIKPYIPRVPAGHSM